MAIAVAMFVLWKRGELIAAPLVGGLPLAVRRTRARVAIAVFCILRLPLIPFYQTALLGRILCDNSDQKIVGNCRSSF